MHLPSDSKATNRRRRYVGQKNPPGMDASPLDFLSATGVQRAGANVTTISQDLSNEVSYNFPTTSKTTYWYAYEKRRRSPSPGSTGTTTVNRVLGRSGVQVQVGTGTTMVTT